MNPDDYIVETRLQDPFVVGLVEKRKVYVKLTHKKTGIAVTEIADTQREALLIAKLVLQDLLDDWEVEE